MANGQLVEAIGLLKEKGENNQQIINELLIKGFKKSEIDMSIAFLDKEEENIDKLHEWIIGTLKNGYTPAELKDYLIKKGYSRFIINKAFENITHMIPGVRDEDVVFEHSDFSISEQLKSNGRAFETVFFASIILFLLITFAVLIYSIFNPNIIVILFGLLLLLNPVIKLFVGRKIDSSLYGLFLPFILIVGCSIYLQALFNLGSNLVYALILLISLGSAGLMSYLLYKSASDEFHMLKPAIVFSLFISLLFSINQMVAYVMGSLYTELYQHAESYQQIIPPLLTYVHLFSSELISSHIGFALSMAFNLPFIAFFMMRKDRDMNYLFLFAVPVISYVLFASLFGWLGTLVVGYGP